MHDEVYSDGIGDITVTGSIVRIDLVSLSRSERDGRNQPRPVFRQRVIMPLDGFVRSFSAMEQVMNRLVQAGVLERQEAAEEPVLADAGGHHAEEPAPVLPRSPNFG